MKLKRMYARACFILGSLGLLGWITPAVAGSFGLPLSQTVSAWLIGVGTVFMVSLGLIRLLLLKCPHCGKGIAIPQWSAHYQHCHHCGKQIEWE